MNGAALLSCSLFVGSECCVSLQRNLLLSLFSSKLTVEK
jgi:hypothetical protein